MHVGLVRIALRLHDSQSLKSRRQVARSLTDRIRGRFNVAVAEDSEEDGNAWQRLTLLVSCVSNDSGHADSILANVVDYIANTRPDLELLEYGTEIISGV